MPAIKYVDKDGNRVPSVTTVLSQWGEKYGPLMFWAFKRGKEGANSLYENMIEANAGTCAHAMIECRIKGIEFDSSGYSVEVLEQAQKAFNSYKAWERSSNLKPLQTELSLVSEKHKFGGTIDLVAEDNNGICIVDWKTGKDVYLDNKVQVASYKELWNENFPEHPVSGGFHIIRTGKELCGFEHHWYDDFPMAFDVFLELRKLYDMTKQIKKVS